MAYLIIFHQVCQHQILKQLNIRQFSTVSDNFNYHSEHSRNDGNPRHSSIFNSCFLMTFSCFPVDNRPNRDYDFILPISRSTIHKYHKSYWTLGKTLPNTFAICFRNILSISESTSRKTSISFCPVHLQIDFET